MWIILRISWCCFHELVYSIAIRYFSTCLQAGASKCSNVISTICCSVRVKTWKREALEIRALFRGWMLPRMNMVHFCLTKCVWSNNKGATCHFRNTCFNSKMKTWEKHSLLFVLVSLSLLEQVVVHWVMHVVDCKLAVKTPGQLGQSYFSLF